MDGILVVDVAADAVGGVAGAPAIPDVESLASLMGAFCEEVKGWLMELKARCSRSESAGYCMIGVYLEGVG